MSNTKPLIPVVIDWETLDTVCTAQVLSLGAVAIDVSSWIDTAIQDDEYFYSTINIQSQPYASVSYDTQSWWTKQNSEAYEEAFSGKEHVQDTLIRFKSFLLNLCEGDLSRIRLYGFGADFDIPLIYFHAKEWRVSFPPLLYRGHRCLRTLQAIYGKEIPKVESEYPHIALYDAKAEAEWLARLIAAHPEVLA